MATGGMGDVLTGMVAAWLAQLLDAEAACKLAVYLHGLAGDLAEAAEGEVALTPSDVVAQLGDAVLELTARRKGSVAGRRTGGTVANAERTAQSADAVALAMRRRMPDRALVLPSPPSRRCARPHLDDRPRRRLSARRSAHSIAITVVAVSRSSSARSATSRGVRR